ncbi:hypothetical protein PR048_004781 [Dryococelus australis]|uniref:Uncharacterized protein n=1 Tax=Dryococelus australis TaxID=614101 RepID=A0ABQ9I6D0_9NEOP|nr:hypothetical protein PR048_004781 [Dryococelus australis]
MLALKELMLLRWPETNSENEPFNIKYWRTELEGAALECKGRAIPEKICRPAASSSSWYSIQSMSAPARCRMIMRMGRAVLACLHLHCADCEIAHCRHRTKFHTTDTGRCGDVYKKAKGIQKCVTRKKITFEDCVHVLSREKTLRVSVHGIRSHQKQLCSECRYKLALVRMDDKGQSRADGADEANGEDGAGMADGAGGDDGADGAGRTDLTRESDLLMNSQCDSRAEHLPRRRHRGANPRPSVYRWANPTPELLGQGITRPPQLTNISFNKFLRTELEMELRRNAKTGGNRGSLRKSTEQRHRSAVGILVCLRRGNYKRGASRRSMKCSSHRLIRISLTPISPASGARVTGLPIKRKVNDNRTPKAYQESRQSRTSTETSREVVVVESFWSHCGALELWNDGVMDYGAIDLWSYGAMELLSCGAMERWSNGGIKLCSYGVMEQWSFEAMELWNYGVMKRQIYGAMELWKGRSSMVVEVKGSPMYSQFIFAVWEHSEKTKILVNPEENVPCAPGFEDELTRFEPVREKPIGFQVQLLNRSDTAADDS